MVPVVSLAFAASKVLLSTPGRVFYAACTIATPGTYYLILLDSVTEPSDNDNVAVGAHGALLACFPIATSVANQTVPVDFTIASYPSDSGVRCGVGCIVYLSSTAPTSVTKVSSGLWVNGGVG